METSYAKELKVAVAAVRRAAALSEHVLASAQQQQRQKEDDEAPDEPSREDMGVVAKDDLSPVTIADFAIQALLTCTIHHAFPDDKFVGEESADALRQSPALLSRVWDALQHTRRVQEQEHEQRSSAAGGEGADGDEDEDEDEDVAAASLVRYPSSTEQMCEMIDWCGEGHPGRGGRTWVFDPIDGTENFVRGLVYAINAALLDDASHDDSAATSTTSSSSSKSNRQVLSVVGCPNMSASVSYPAGDASLDPSGEGCIVVAARGAGTFVRKLRRRDGQPTGTPHYERLPHRADASTTTTTTEASSLRSVSARNASGLGQVHAEVARRLGVEWPGSTLLPWVIRWVLLALGVGDATWWVYKERGRLAKIWDHAGAMLLFEEVGGHVTDVDGRDIDLTANRKMTANYGFVAAPAHLHAQVLAAVQEVLREQKPELMAAGPA